MAAGYTALVSCPMVGSLLVPSPDSIDARARFSNVLDRPSVLQYRLKAEARRRGETQGIL